jgi:Transposase IS200 like
VRHYRLGAHTKSDLKVHLVWVPKYRRAVLSGEVAIRVRDLLRQIAAEHKLEIVSGKVARDHVHLLRVMFALTYRLLLRSCKLIGVFLKYPCLPCC